MLVFGSRNQLIIYTIFLPKMIMKGNTAHYNPCRFIATYHYQSIMLIIIYI